jgi:hypothetical protein
MIDTSGKARNWLLWQFRFSSWGASCFLGCRVWGEPFPGGHLESVFSPAVPVSRNSVGSWFGSHRGLHTGNGRFWGDSAWGDFWFLQQTWGFWTCLTLEGFDPWTNLILALFCIHSVHRTSCVAGTVQQTLWPARGGRLFWDSWTDFLVTSVFSVGISSDWPEVALGSWSWHWTFCRTGVFGTILFFRNVEDY